MYIRYARKKYISKNGRISGAMTELVKPRSPNKSNRGISVWYGNLSVSYDSSLFVEIAFAARFHIRAIGCIISQAKLAQPDVKQ